MEDIHNKQMVIQRTRIHGRSIQKQTNKPELLPFPPPIPSLPPGKARAKFISGESAEIRENTRIVRGSTAVPGLNPPSPLLTHSLFFPSLSILSFPSRPLAATHLPWTRVPFIPSTHTHPPSFPAFQCLPAAKLYRLLCPFRSLVDGFPRSGSVSAFRRAPNLSISCIAITG